MNGHLGFFIIVAVTLFGALLGVLGALTAVPLAAIIQIFVKELTRARREKIAELKANMPGAGGNAAASVALPEGTATAGGTAGDAV